MGSELQATFAAYGIVPFSDDTGEPFAEWYVREVAMREAAIAEIKRRAKDLTVRLERQIQALDTHYGRDFERHCKRDIDRAPGKRKSFDYLTGRAGTRRSTRIEVDDEQAAIAWFTDNGVEQCLRRSVRLARDEAKDFIRTNKIEVPGLRVIEEDRFYIRSTIKPEQYYAHEPLRLEGGDGGED